jgi:hypothetical protein
MANQSTNNSAQADASRKCRAAECYKRGVHLATRERNYDYAHAMSAECVMNDCGNEQYVAAMIQNLTVKTPRAKNGDLHLGAIDHL